MPTTMRFSARGHAVLAARLRNGRPAVAPVSGQQAAAGAIAKRERERRSEHQDRTWLVGLDFRNANPIAAADIDARVALASRPRRQRGWG